MRRRAIAVESEFHHRGLVDRELNGPSIGELVNGAWHS